MLFLGNEIKLNFNYRIKNNESWLVFLFWKYFVGYKNIDKWNFLRMVYVYIEVGW